MLSVSRGVKEIIEENKLLTFATFQIINHRSPEYYLAVKLREAILRKPLGLTFLPAELEAEKEHIQIAGFQNDEVISTAVLV